MTTVTLTNRGTYNAVENVLWALGFEIGNNKNAEGSKADYSAQTAFLGQSIPGGHKLVASGSTPPAGTTVDARTGSQLKITTDAFSEERNSVIGTFDIKGSNLDKSDASASANGLTIFYKSKKYLSDAMTPATHASTGEGKFTVDTRYQPATLVNESTTDGEIRFTSFTQTGKFSQLLKDDGTASDIRSSSNFKMTGSFIAHENGSTSGTVKTLSDQRKETGSEASSANISLSSKNGVSFVTSGALTGDFDKIALTASYTNNAHPDWAGNVSLNLNGAVNGFTSAIGDFAQGQLTVGQLALVLYAGADTMTAKSGYCTLDGYGGNDTLVGGKGIDIFTFSTTLGTGNVDTIKNFKKSGTDRISLDDAVFTAITDGVSDNSFYAGTAAHDADDRIIYNSKTGGLYYDADGNGSGAAVQFATIVGKVNLSAADFSVV